MPEHILSGIKAIIAKKKKDEGMIQREIGDYLKTERSVVSHYLNGRYPSEKVLIVANEIINLDCVSGTHIINSLSEDKELTSTLLKEIYGKNLQINIGNNCIMCGKCHQCEFDAIYTDNYTYITKIDNNKCMLCGICLKLCDNISLTNKNK